MSDSMKNDYLEEVVAKQQQVQSDLRVNRKMASPSPAQAAAPRLRGAGAVAEAAAAIHPREARAMGIPAEENVGNAVEVRITGMWRWKTVIVPPNAHVVHTRRGRTEPLHIGMGVSFPFDPKFDSYLVVPGAMQTILINAHCICRELQGLLVQGYVQWIVADFATAYKKLDFSDTDDPMRVVNVQLREQAEAAIKDKVATMGIDDVLSDKQPIIEELTSRLRHVAEGEGSTDKGLGLRIVTVQIKEAVVSSPRLWENLQKPFRADRGRIARLAELEADSVIQARELEHRNKVETAELESESKLNQLRADQDALNFNRENSEKVRRQQKDMEAARASAVERSRTEEAEVEHARQLAEARATAKHQELLKALELKIAETAKQGEAARAAHVLELEKAQKAAELLAKQLEATLARDKAAATGQIEVAKARAAAANAQGEAENELLAGRQKVLNATTAAGLQLRLLEQLPVVAEKLPKPDELRVLSMGDGGSADTRSLAALVASVSAILEGFRRPNGKGAEG